MIAIRRSTQYSWAFWSFVRTSKPLTGAEGAPGVVACPEATPGWAGAPQLGQNVAPVGNSFPQLAQNILSTGGRNTRVYGCAPQPSAGAKRRRRRLEEGDEHACSYPGGGEDDPAQRHQEERPRREEPGLVRKTRAAHSGVLDHGVGHGDAYQGRGLDEHC